MGYDVGNNQFGRGNVWASLKSLFNNRAGFFIFSTAPTSGTAGTFAGQAGIGASLLALDTGVWYTNRGTLLSPVWWNSDPVSLGLGGLAGVGLAKMSYNTAVDGLAQGTITPVNSPTLPNKAIILGGTIDITTTLTSGGSATIAVGTSAGSSTTSIKGATAVASWTAGQLAMVPVFTAATYLKLTAAGRLTVTIATADLLTGAFDVQVAYVIGN